jgi:ubiquinone/menaquinone biosynthesis C-methylase UbiE
MIKDTMFFVNQFRYKSLVPLIIQKTSIDNKKILDFGCGRGQSTFALALEGGICDGIDISKDHVLIAKKTRDEHFSELRINFNYLSQTKSLPYKDGHFDMVVCNAVFEHIHPKEREDHFAEIYRLTKPGGEIIIRGTPNRLFPKDGHTSELWFVPWLPLIIAKYYVIFRNGAIKKSDKLAKKKITIKQKIKDIPPNEWYDRGIRGLALKDLNLWIDNNDFNLELLNFDNKSEIERYVNNSPTWGKKKLFIFFIRLVGKVLDTLSISYHNFSPYLNLIYKRKGWE